MSRRSIYRGSPKRFDVTPDMKVRLNEAFNTLRRIGYVARQGFSCCNGCAGYELATYVGEKMKVDARFKAKFRGVVFYHRQDADGLYEDGQVFISYGPVDIDGVGTVGAPTADVGKDVCDVLEAVGIPYVWDGSPSTRILARLDLFGKEFPSFVEVERGV